MRHLLDQLEKYRFEEIFPGLPQSSDIHEYLLEKGVQLNGVKGQQYLYHDPCHTPIKTMNATQMASSLMGQKVVLSDRCCGESGMFAVKRPDIATQVKFRKQEEIEKNLKELPQGEPVKMLTSCPACLQGLSRYADDNDMPADYIVIEMAKHILGEKLAGRVCEKSQQRRRGESVAVRRTVFRRPQRSSENRHSLNRRRDFGRLE